MKTIGIYIHIPFCRSKCDYCDFCSYAGRDELAQDYQNAVIRHVKEFAPRLAGYYVDTVYFGGGTPTHYGASRLIALFDALKSHLKVLRTAEVTLEANPESVDVNELYRLRRAGFNRLSLGVQSLDDITLKRVGRIHTAEEALDAIDRVRESGFDNLSLDLIYGLPGQSREEWAETLNRALRTTPEHISAYGLTIEENTPLWRLRNSQDIPNDDAQADMYLYAADTIADAGYQQYEISNFAMRGKESKHNLKYWRLNEYCGFGCSASSYLGGMRYTYLRDPKEYIKAVNSGAGITIAEETETLTPYENAAEYIMLGMRTNYGVSREEYELVYRGGFAPLEQMLESYIKMGFAQKRDNRYSFTAKGFLLSNRLIGELLDAQAERKFQVGTPWRESDYYGTLFN
ncbi:MAG: radical SAM family heme chaperone HemW [Oscillospiraceae bacterium]|jgi:oxygen-independent coproporphyrinogen-3 oxidase|nr:radical SAM family heme chaperone HemW [Oscillospiraceae bacterium]